MKDIENYCKICKANKRDFDKDKGYKALSRDIYLAEIAREEQMLFEKLHRILAYTNIPEQDFFYLKDILLLIHDEELCHPRRQKGRRLPYPWELRNFKAILIAETYLTIKKRIGNKSVELNINDMPDFLMEKIKNFLNSLMNMRAEQFAKGKITTTCSLTHFTNEGETYIVTLKNTAPFSNINVETHKKFRKGPRGTPQSNLAIYLLYRYFKHIKLRKMYQTITLLCNEISSIFFRPVTGAPLFPENVRKRIQWLKKRKSLVEYAEKFEKEKLITLNS